MTVSIERLDCGTLTAPRSMFEADRGEDTLTVPVPAWLIRHPSGIALFDCGMHTDLTRDTPTRQVVELFFGLGIDDDTLVTGALAAHDVDPTDVDVVIMSHLHFDHTGGLAQIPDATVIVQEDEWRAGFDDELAAANSFTRTDYDLGHVVHTIDGEHDVFGDGRVTCIPTPGHTPGHQSLRVRLDTREVVLCADCAYFTRTIDGEPLPGVGHDHDAQRTSLARLRDLRADGATLVPGHDPDALAALPARLT